MPTVYVVQDVQDRDITSCHKFGEPKVLLTGGDVTVSTAETVAKLRKLLAKFKPAEDSLLLIGDPVWIGLSMTVLASLWDTYVILKWSRNRKEYRSIVIDTTELF